MAVEGEKVSVGTTATALAAVESHAFGGDKVSVGVKNPSGGVDVFVGGSDVAASGANTGFLLEAGETVSFGDLGLGEVPYAIVATGTQDVYVVRHGVG